MRLTPHPATEAAAIAALRERKAQVRAEALARRAAVGDLDRHAIAGRLVAATLDLAAQRSPSPAVVSAFHPFRGEPDTLPLIGALAAAGFATALPVTVVPRTPLRFRAWRPGEALVRARFGLMEPGPDAAEVEPDLLIVPLAAFDRHGGRLGYGAGYYDATLAALRQRRTVLAIGAAFAVQEVAAVPSEPHDERLDAVVTDRETLLIGR